jgi:hypothetical protein
MFNIDLWYNTKPLMFSIAQRPVCLTKDSCLARALGVTKFISMILATLCCATQVGLTVQYQTFLLRKFSAHLVAILP